MATKEKTPVNNANKIGQTYEERKKDGTIGRIGVIEEVNDKFKTYLMRDKEGVSFNITFATLKSNWRKHQEDEEQIKTSAQKEEDKEKQQKELKVAKQEMEKSTETTVKFDKQERLDAIKAMRVVLSEAIKNRKYEMKVIGISKGGTVVKVDGKRRTMFEIWLPLRYPDVYSFRMREDLDKYVELDEEREYLEKDINCVRYRPKRERFNEVLEIMLSAVERFMDDLEKEKEKVENEENENNEEG